MTTLVSTIICPVSLDDSDVEVLTRALDEATAHDAKIVVVHAVEPINPTAKSLLDSLGPDDRIARSPV